MQNTIVDMLNFSCFLFCLPVVPLEKGRIPRVSSTSNDGLFAYPAPSFRRNCDNGVALVFESSVTVMTCI